MKLIALKFRGVGPYKGEYAIDFAALTRLLMIVASLPCAPLLMASAILPMLKAPLANWLTQ